MLAKVGKPTTAETTVKEWHQQLGDARKVGKQAIAGVSAISGIPTIA
jgi:hypothetical protein